MKLTCCCGASIEIEIGNADHAKVYAAWDAVHAPCLVAWRKMIERQRAPDSFLSVLREMSPSHFDEWMKTMPKFDEGDPT